MAYEFKKDEDKKMKSQIWVNFFFFLKAHLCDDSKCHS